MSNDQPKMTHQQQSDLLKNLDVAKIIEVNKDKLQNLSMESAANARAEREPIPTTVSEAFTGNDIVVKTSAGNVSIRKMLALDITIFKLTDSPFYKLIMGDLDENKDEPIKDSFKKMFPNEEVIFALIYQFTRPVKEIYRAVKKNKQEYHDMVMETIGGEYENNDILILMNAILQHIGVVNEAKIQFDAVEQISDGEDKKKL